MEHLVRAAALDGYGPLAASLGLDARALLREAGLDRGACADPDDLLPNAAVRWLFEETARRAGTDDFGLRLAATRSQDHFGTIALALRAEATLGEVLAAMARYTLLHNDGIAMRIEPGEGEVFLRLDFLATGQLRQSSELSVAMLLRTIRAVLHPDWLPLLTCFCHDAPEAIAPQQHLFGRDLAFGCEADGMVIACSDLERTLPTADPHARRALRARLDQRLAESATRFELSVKQLIRTLLPIGQCTVARTAHLLGVDRRTVHRRLAAEHTTFSALLDEARRELATRFLEANERPLAEVADLLGFAAQSGFTRWFARTFATTPSHWRKDAVRDGPHCRTSGGGRRAAHAVRKSMSTRMPVSV